MGSNLMLERYLDEVCENLPLGKDEVVPVTDEGDFVLVPIEKYRNIILILRRYYFAPDAIKTKPIGVPAGIYDALRKSEV